MSRQQVLLYGWEEFCDEVKHRNRYFSFEPAESTDDLLNVGESLSPSEVLQEIERLVNELSLLRIIPKGHIFTRARVCEIDAPHTRAARLGPPPGDAAIFSNRMSPAGVPMFYGAEDTETAVLEVAEGASTVSVGDFETLRDLTLLDLTNLPATPSVYIAEAAETRFGVTFLKRFVRDLRKPIEKDGREHIEYVPTQVVTEYFRHVFRAGIGEPIHGILYPSGLVKR